MDKVIIIGERPADVPEDWTIYNAPRPLYGHKEWQGDFRHGCFYVAVAPKVESEYDLRPEFCHERNKALDGWPVEYVAWEAVVKWARKFLAGKKVRLADLSRADITNLYLRHWHGGEDGP